MNPVFHCIQSFDKPGDWQMALDDVMLRRVEEGVLGPVLRLYTWSPWCVTLGNFQEAEDQIDVEAARRMGVDVVRRITGGRAVFHAQEVTYTICAPKDIAPWGKTLGQTYDWVAERLLEGLEQIGFDGNLDRGDHAVLERGADRRLVKPPCFSSASRSEIVWNGRKLVGSAQRRTRRAFLQHGSILLGPAHLDLVDLLEFPAEKKPQVRAELEEHSVCLNQVPGCSAEPSQVMAALLKSFGQHLHLHEWELPADVEAEIAILRPSLHCYSGKQKEF